MRKMLSYKNSKNLKCFPNLWENWYIIKDNIYIYRRECLKKLHIIKNIKDIGIEICKIHYNYKLKNHE